MANAIANGDILEIRVCCQSRDQIGVNVLHYRAHDLTGFVFDTDVVADAFTLFKAAYEACLSQDANFYGASVQIIHPTRRPANALGVLTAGTVASDRLPMQVCGFIRKKSVLANRHGRGRVYIPFPARSALDTDETPTGGYVTSLGGVATLIESLPTIAPATGTLGLDGVIWDRVALTYVTIQYAEAVKRWGTQRRRGDFGRTNALPW